MAIVVNLANSWLQHHVTMDGHVNLEDTKHELCYIAHLTFPKEYIENFENYKGNNNICNFKRLTCDFFTYLKVHMKLHLIGNKQ